MAASARSRSVARAAAVDVGTVEEADVMADADTGADDIARPNGPAGPPRDPGSDPWRALAQVGVQFVAALAAAGDPKAPAHPWIERDRATGAQSLRMPLPEPETARQLANALSALADGVRGRFG
jgi:hypothetical protein